jgi:hypothetical protein
MILIELCRQVDMGRVYKGMFMNGVYQKIGFLDPILNTLIVEFLNEKH